MAMGSASSEDCRRSSFRPACLSDGRALCTPHHLPFCPLAVLLLSIVDAEKVRGHRTDTGVAHIWLSVGVLYFDGESTRDVAYTLGARTTPVVVLIRRSAHFRRPQPSFLFFNSIKRSG